MKQLFFTLIFLNLLYSNSIAIYSNNLAFVNQNYDTNLTKATDKITISNLPKTVITNSIFVSNLNPLSKEYIPKDYNYVKSLIEANLNSKVSFVYNKKELNGVLINQEPLTIKSDKKIYLIKNPSSIIFNTIPNYKSSSKLILHLKNKELVKKVDLNYLINSITWSANYIVNLKKDKLNIEMWADIQNRSGVDFNNYNIKLIAGDVNRVSHPRVMYKNTKALASPAVAMERSLSVNVRPISGYYSFEIPQKETIKKHIQILIDTSKDIKYKEYAIATNQSFYRYNESKLNFTKELVFENKKSNNLGKILPQGIARVYKRGYYIGEDRVKNTPKNKTKYRKSIRHSRKQKDNRIQRE